MKANEHNTKKRSAKTGFFAMLANLPPVRGTAAPSSTPSGCAGVERAHLPAPARMPARHRRFVPATLAITALLLALSAQTAFAFVFPPAAHIKGCTASGHTSLILTAEVEASEGSDELAVPTTQWSFKYSTAKGGPFAPVPGAGGTITHGEFEADIAKSTRTEFNAIHPIEANLNGLTPEVPYYVLLTLSSSAGTVELVVGTGFGPECETVPLRPGLLFEAGEGVVSNHTATTAQLHGRVNPRGFETHWRFDSAASESGPWAPVPGAEGTITQAEAEAILAEGEARHQEVSPDVEAKLTGLTPSTAYFVRLSATSEPEFEGHTAPKQAFSDPVGFQTEGPPTDVFTFAVHSLHGEDMHALGSLRPNSTPSSEEQTITIAGAPAGGTFSLAFGGQSTGATGTGNLAVASSATGSGDLSAATGRGISVIGSNVLTQVSTIDGAFVVGQMIKDPGHVPPLLPAGTTITAVGPESLTLSANATYSSIFREAFTAGSPTVTNLITAGGAFAVGQKLTAAGHPAGRIIAVGSGTLTLSHFPSGEQAGTGVSLSAATDTREVTDLHTATGAFTEGEAISGPGIPAGTTITAVGPESITLSADATASGTAVPLSADLPFDATREALLRALQNFSSLKPGPDGEGTVSVRGPTGGPYVVEFRGDLAGKDQPQITADASGLTPSGEVIVATRQDGGVGLDTRYHFEYTTTDFSGCGEPANPNCLTTPEVDLGFGQSENGQSKLEFVGADLPATQPGKTYRYRLAATSNAPGSAVIHGEEQSLTVPVPAAAASEASCANQALRTGPSAKLPDCRAYEQLTPVDKGGAQEIENYGTSGGEAAIGEDGDHLMLEAQTVNWDSSPDAGQSPYFFSRDPGRGWQLTAATPQPEAGVSFSTLQIFNPDLTQLAFGLGFETGSPEASSLSPNLEYKTGPPGGPYTVAAVVPRKLAGGGGGVAGNTEDGGWAASSADFSKLILRVEDHELLGAGSKTATKSGADLYEYSAGSLRQANVTGSDPGTTIGKCGAEIVRGVEGYAGGVSGSAPEGRVASRNAVSADGRRVFFEAVPSGKGCSEPTHLYMRLDGGAADAQTLDIGPYRFVAANPAGTELLLADGAGDGVLYDTESATAQPLTYGGSEHRALPLGSSVVVSADLGTIYFEFSGALTAESPPVSASHADGYRYDVATGTLSFTLPGFGAPTQLSGDGRFAFLDGAPALIPAGGISPTLVKEKEEGLNVVDLHSSQVFSFNSAEDLIQCMSCASAFDPEPKLNSFFGPIEGPAGRKISQDGLPRLSVVSANGDYAFFDTPAALLPSDVDGEREPESLVTSPGGSEHDSEYFSPSSDVYQWRRDGVDGCASVKGCLSLISSGRGGYLVLLLGSAAEGRDVFFTTASQLGTNDKDTALDIYDARIGGGFPSPPPRAVECEGDACSTPFSAPNDLTPSSSAFQGAGNLIPSLTVTKSGGSPPPRRCKAGFVRRKGKCVRRRRARKAARRPAGRRHGGHR